MFNVVIFIVFNLGVYGESIFYGNNFVCDDNINNTSNILCNYGDNIVCDSNIDCIIDCNYGCNGVIINAKNALSLTINDCFNCNDMIIYCPQNTENTGNNKCNLNIMNDVSNINIYAQESFYDFNIYASTKSDYLLSSKLHCGDLNIIEYICYLNNGGDSCIDTRKKCQNYRITTMNPTVNPSQLPTMTPTLLPTNSPTLNTQTTQITDTDMLVEENVVLNGNNDDSINHHMYYIVLIIGLTVIWSSFFVCFMILNHFRSKQNEMVKAVTIMSRPQTPTYHSQTRSRQNTMSYQSSPRKYMKPQKHIYLDPPSRAPPTAPSNNSIYHHNIQQNQDQQQQHYPHRKTHTEVNEIYKVRSLSDVLRLKLNEYEQQSDTHDRSIVVESINLHIHSPNHHIKHQIDCKQLQIDDNDNASSTYDSSDDQDDQKHAPSTVVGTELSKDISAASNLDIKEEEDPIIEGSKDSNYHIDVKRDDDDPDVDDIIIKEGDNLNDNINVIQTPLSPHLPPPSLKSPKQYSHYNNQPGSPQNQINQRKFLFNSNVEDTFNKNKVSREHQYSQSNYLQPPLTPRHGNFTNFNIPPPPLPRHIYPSITPGPKSQIAVPQSRSRGFSDPVYPVKQSK